MMNVNFVTYVTLILIILQKNQTQGPESSRLMEAWKANKPNGVFIKWMGAFIIGFTHVNVC